MFAMSRAALVAAIALTLAACSSDDANEASSLTMTDTWVKAAESGMTAAFGELTNDSDATITITAAHSDAATMVELHEVVDEAMRQVDGGLVVPAHGSLTLEPGGFHLMFMGVTEPVAAGDEVEITLTLDDGSEFVFTAVAKDFAGANEDYDGGMDMSSATPSANG